MEYICDHENALCSFDGPCSICSNNKGLSLVLFVFILTIRQCVSFYHCYQDNYCTEGRSTLFNGGRRPADVKFTPRSRSPGPGSRGPTSPTSPHPRFSTLSLEPPVWRQEGCRSPSHPLPLPPGSPTSPSSVLSPRMTITHEIPNSNVSKWKRGKLLGQGTFGNVYMGFNR